MESKEVVHLEVQEGTSCSGDAAWRDVGPITVLDSAEVQPPSSDAHATPLGGSVGSSGNKRPQLPKSVKKWLMSGKPKEERKNSYLYRHAPNQGPNTNLFILLHGAGDTHVRYDKLGQTMALPQTATLAIHASSQKFVALPFGLGFTWFQEMNYNTGETLNVSDSVRMSSLQAAVNHFVSVLDLLIAADNCWMPERIFFFGYGAGAALTMSICHEWYLRHSATPLGGAICVGGGGCLHKGDKQEHKPQQDNPKATPILLLVGSDNTEFTPQMARHAKRTYQAKVCAGHVDIHIEPNKGMGMISTPNEMKSVMEFVAPKLVRSMNINTNHNT